MEVPEPITVYPIYPLDWIYVLSTILDHVIDQAQDNNRNILAMLILKTRIVNTLSLFLLTSLFLWSELKRVNKITYPNVNIVSNTRAGIYRLQIMTKRRLQ